MKNWMRYGIGWILGIVTVMIFGTGASALDWDLGSMFSGLVDFFTGIGEGIGAILAPIIGVAVFFGLLVGVTTLAVAAFKKAFKKKPADTPAS